MKNQEHEDAAKATIKAAIEAATSAGTLLAATAMPMACVADASHATRTFLADTLEGFGFATSECAQLTALNAALDAGPARPRRHRIVRGRNRSLRDDGAARGQGLRRQGPGARSAHLADGGSGAGARREARSRHAAVAGDAVHRRHLARRRCGAGPGEARAGSRRRERRGCRRAATRADVPAQDGCAYARAQRRRGGDRRRSFERRDRAGGAGDRPPGGRLAQLPCPDRRSRDRGRAADRVPSGSGVGRNAVPAVARSADLRGTHHRDRRRGGRCRAGRS